MKIKDIKFNPPNHPFAVDVLRNQSTENGDTLICISCSKEYKRGVWDFYSLCNKCFTEFDKQKMMGRFSGTSYFEDAAEWVKNRQNAP